MFFLTNSASKHKIQIIRQILKRFGIMQIGEWKKNNIYGSLFCKHASGKFSFPFSHLETVFLQLTMREIPDFGLEPF